MKRIGIWALGAALITGTFAGSPEAAMAEAVRVITTASSGNADAKSWQMIGKVVDVKGAPVPKANVALYSHGISREQVSRSNGTRPQATVVADEKGSFTLSVTDNFSQTLAVTAPGYLPEIDRFYNNNDLRHRLQQTAQGTTFTREIVLQKQSQRSGIVADADGKPLPGVKVVAYPYYAPSSPEYGYGTSLEEAETDGDGRFRFDAVPEGGLTLKFTAPGFATNYLRVPGDQKDIAINMMRGATLTGTVVEFGTDKAMDDVWVQVSAISAGQPLPPDSKERRLYPYSWSERALTGESGNFLLRNVPPGEYTVSIAQVAGQDEQKLAVWNPGSNGRIKVTVPEAGDPPSVQVPVFNGYSISGTVVEAGTTATVPGATVWMMNTYPNTRVQADANGHFELGRVFDRGMISLTATADGYEMVNPSNYGGNTTITLSLELPTTSTQAHFNIPMNRQQVIKGVVMDAATSTPLEGATVQVVDNNYYPQSNQKKNLVYSGANGRFELSLFPGDSIRLRAEQDGYAPTVSDPISTKVEQELVLAMHRGVTVDGIVVDPDNKPVAEARISGTINMGESQPGANNRYNEPFQSTSTDAEGRFHLENIMPGGKLTMIASEKGFAMSEPGTYVTLPGENITSVVLQLRKGTFLAGHVYDTDGKPLKDVILNARSIGTYGYSHARSADDGSYRMEDIPDAPMDVTIFHFQQGTEVFYDVAVGRDGVDFKFGTGDKNGMKRAEHERERNKKDKSGVTLEGKAVDYKTGLPVKDIKVVGNYRMDITLDPDKPGEFTATGLLISSPYQSIKIYAAGYAPYDSGSLYVFPGEKLIKKTFKLGPGGSVIGRAVEQGTGKPVPGVIVSLGADLTSAKSNPSAEKVQPVVTGADGRFNLIGVGQGRKVVEFQPPPETGFVKMSQQVDVVYNEATDLKDVEFGSGGTIKGKLVRTPGDVPIPNAQVTLRGENPVTTGADGAFSFSNLVNGLYYLEAPQYGANLWVGIEQLETKEVSLEVGTGKLVGLVTRGGRPVSCAVKLVKVGYGQSVARGASSDSAGRFIVEGLAPGRWSVTFSKDGGAGFSAEEAIIMPESGESLEKTFALPSAALQVTVVDAGGTAVEGATVIVRQEQAAGSVIAGDGKSRQTNANGIAGFDGLEGGSYSITATDRDGLRGAKHNVAIQDNGSAAETITLESAPGGTLVSTALNLSNGKPVPTAWCYLFNDKGQMFEHANQRDELGVMTIENIPPGTYRVQVSAFSFSVSEKTIEIRAGETQSIDDVLYPAGAVRWALRDASGAPVVGAACTLKPADANSVEGERSGVSNADGVFIARGLMQGAYIGEAKGANGTARAMINIYAGNATDEVTLVK